LAALSIQPTAVVHSFEPTPEIAARLRTTAKLNKLDQLNVHEVAVSNKDGFASLYDCRGEFDTNEGMNFIRTGISEPGARRVRTVRLDQFCREHAIDCIDLLKIDIQGHEHSALAGAEQLLRQGRIGTIFIELNWTSDVASICPAAESIRMLEQAGYSFSKLGPTLEWNKPGSWLRSMTDVIARRIGDGGFADHDVFSNE
jgi:FkbM family methyltransferase